MVIDLVVKKINRTTTTNENIVSGYKGSLHLMIPSEFLDGSLDKTTRYLMGEFFRLTISNSVKTSTFNYENNGIPL